jgi:CRISPR-associated endonuclease Cas3-HD
MYIAHIREEDKAKQSLMDHLYGTADLAGAFGEAFNNREYAYLCGLLHDLGKYSKEFQKRLLNKLLC